MSLATPFTANSLNTIIHEGILHKRGKVNSSWKKRWFVLTKSFKLEYCESKHKYNKRKNILGTIDLLTIQKIEVSHLKDINLSSIPKYIKILPDDKIKDKRSCLIYITTPKRLYKLSANDNLSCLKWLKHLHEQLYENIIYESFLQKKNENNKLFEKFYFVLSKNEQNKTKYLKYYNNETRDILIGYLDLNSPLFILTIQTTDKCIELIPDHIKNIKSISKYILFTKNQKYFNKWFDYLREHFINYNKNKMNENDNFNIESDTESYDYNTLNLSAQNLKNIPVSLCLNIAHNVSKLILTNNKLKSLKELKYFTNLNILQLDRNGLTNIDDLPKLPHLTTLWLNNNQIKNINRLLLTLKQQCPNIEYLSLLFNPLCFSMNEKEYKRYRKTFIYHLPNLRFLDTVCVKYKERNDSIYGVDDFMDSNLHTTKINGKWNSNTMSMEQHDEELKKQLVHLVEQINTIKSRLYE